MVYICTIKQVKHYYRQLYHISTSHVTSHNQTSVQHTQQYRNAYHQDVTHAVKQITPNITAQKQSYVVPGATAITTQNQSAYTNTFHAQIAEKSDIMAKAESSVLCPTAIEMSTSNSCQSMTHHKTHNQQKQKQTT